MHGRGRAGVLRGTTTNLVVQHKHVDERAGQVRGFRMEWGGITVEHMDHGGVGTCMGEGNTWRGGGDAVQYTGQVCMCDERGKGAREV